MIVEPIFLVTIACAVVSFLICGIPFGLIVSSKMAGVDIRTTGSGNIGTTNVSRTLGPQAGAITLLLDAAKGAICCFVSSLVIAAVACGGDGSAVAAGGTFDWSIALVYLACVTGHIFSPYLHFHGGKGIAVGFGSLLGFVWPVGIVALMCFFVLAIPTRYVSAGSLAAAASLPILSWLFYQPSLPFMILMTMAGLTVIWAHRSNIGKLMRGEEKKFSFGSTKKDGE